ncbi:MAG: tetratricopeptide repeat protein [Planctomycetes bacterium]|nr:tetratricopeptide repeat protein [Planctomycetota bacterium]
MTKHKKTKGRKRTTPKRPRTPASSIPTKTVRLLALGIILCIAIAAFYFIWTRNKTKNRQQITEVPISSSEQPLHKHILSTLTTEQQFKVLKKEEMELAQQVLKRFPNSDNLYVLMGDLYSRHGNSSEANKFWKRSLEINPNRFDACRNMAQIALEKEQFDQAVQLFRKALEIRPRALGVRCDIAKVLMDTGKYAEAITVVEEEIKIFPSSVTAHFQLAEAYRQLKEYDKARQFYEQTINFEPKHSHAHYGLARVYTKMDQRDKAQEHLAAFRKLRSKVTAAYMARRVGPIEDLASLRASVVRTYLDAEPLYRDSGNITKAEELLNRAYEIEPDNTRCLERLGLLYYTTKRPTKALEYFEKVARVDPNNPFSHLNIGQVAARLKMFEKAERAFRKTIELAPSKASGYRELARLYLRNNRNFPRAKKLTQKALSLEKTAANYFLFGWASDVNGDRIRALEAMEKAIKLEPQNRQYRKIYEGIKARN